ncbi:MAG: Sua5/YciO/YrdC/YwlC family protein [Thiofilum sp.]|uniref:L-threonylcarbamoyladenylate synthase n=1 Tax=Thiofilum sp. TaxID=2212733 RepID=UPI0025F39161|nr:Sua5/YciO/YrdC/YwlC family protein [Thiofilum sp.]MBK8452881.1 Sua5/YciO/YrdC/YwlC family protein [Thiofilum sp.]
MAILTNSIDQALQVIQAGGVIAYPTEAVFGLGCDPKRLDAVERILTIKQRPAHKGLILIASTFEQLSEYLAPLEQSILDRVLPTWPDAITWVLPAKPEVSYLLRGEHDTIAVRVSKHPTVKTLCDALNHPLVSTSANIAGEEPFRSALGLYEQLGPHLDLVLDQPLGGRNQPSEIRDGLSGAILRPS